MAKPSISMQATAMRTDRLRNWEDFEEFLCADFISGYRKWATRPRSGSAGRSSTRNHAFGFDTGQRLVLEVLEVSLR